MKELLVGTVLESGTPLSIPIEEVTKATAILGIRETGKSCLGTVMAEELCKLQQPWIALDPVGNWWGLRAKPDGSPGGFPVVVFGGERGDIAIEKGDGRKIAEAVISENVCAVIDLKRTSKTLWRTIVRDLVGTLLELQPAFPRKVFIEEASEFMPQKASYQLGRECSELVERLVTLGGNYGYGATLLGQRSADIAKTALSQCETIFAFAAQGALDRKAYQGWIKSQEAALDSTMLDELADLPTGTAWCWSPRFLKIFQKVQIRRRETFHPRDARKLGVAVADVELAPIDEFVAKVRSQLTKVVASVPGAPKTDPVKKAIAKPTPTPHRQPGEPEALVDALEKYRIEKAAMEGNYAHQVSHLKGELDRERGLRQAAEGRVERVRARLQPEYATLKALFEDLGQQAEAPHGDPGRTSSRAVDRTPYEPLLAKARKRGCGKVLEILFDRPDILKNQLRILAGVSAQRTFQEYMYWLKKAGLVDVDGERVKLRAV